MANFTLAVIGMPRHMMCVLVMVLVPTATLIVLMLFMLVVMMLMPTATVVVLMLLMPVMMMLVSTATVIILILSVPSWALSIMLIATAAVVVLLCGMLVGMAAAITMAMLRDMPHAGMIMVLATVTTGAAFGMVTIIFIPLNMAVHMSKAAHLLGGVTHFF